MLVVQLRGRQARDRLFCLSRNPEGVQVKSRFLKEMLIFTHYQKSQAIEEGYT